MKNDYVVCEGLLANNSPPWRGVSEADGVVKRNTQAYANLPYNPSLKERARELRKAGVLSEVLLWNQLKKGQINGWDFDRQKIIGDYIVDFYCANIGLVIEIDGESHNAKEDHDKERDKFLEELGLRILRISDIDVKRNISGVVEFIRGYDFNCCDCQKSL